MKFFLMLGGLCSSLFWAAPNLAALPASAGGAAQPWPQGSLFPLEVYEVDAADVPMLAAHGWNIFQSYENHNPGQCGQYLATASASRVTGLAAIPYTGVRTNKFELPEAKVAPWVRAVAANDNLAWWDLPEEARPWSPHELKMLQDYTTWTRANDPARRPTYEYTPNNRNAAGLAHIIPEVDVVGLSCYCEEMQMPHAWVRYKIEEAGLHGIALAGATVGRDYLSGQKIPLAVLYCAKFPKTGQMPSPDQTYHDFWSAIVSGAQGIGVYAYHHALEDDPSLVKNFERLNEAAAEISGPEKIGDVVLYGDADPNISAQILSGPEKTVSFRPPTEKQAFQYPSLHVLAKRRGENLYVLAVNSTDQPLTARIAGLPMANQAGLPFEHRSVAVQDHGFTDLFAPWAVHIYKVRTPAMAGDVGKNIP